MALESTCSSDYFSFSDQITCSSHTPSFLVFNFLPLQPLENLVVFSLILSLVVFLFSALLFALLLVRNWCYLHPSIRNIPYVEKPPSMHWWKFVIFGHSPASNLLPQLKSCYPQTFQKVPPMHQSVVFGFNMLMVHWMRNYLHIYDPKRQSGTEKVDADFHEYIQRNSIPFDLISCLRESHLPTVATEKQPTTSSTVPGIKSTTVVSAPICDISETPSSTTSLADRPESSVSSFSSLGSSSPSGIPNFDDFPAHGFIRYRFFLGRVRIAPVSVDAARYVLTKDGEGFEKPELAKRALKNILGVKSIILSSKEYHDRLKKMIQPAFQYIKLKGLTKLFLKHGTWLSQQWENACNVNASHITPNMDHDIMLLTSRTIGESAMGFNCELASDVELLRLHIQSAESVPGITASLANLFLPSSIARLIKSNRIQWDRTTKAREAVAKLIQRRIDLRDHESEEFVAVGNDSLLSKREPDLLDYILDSRDDPQAYSGSSCFQKNALQLSSEEILDQAMTFMFAGQLTTASTINFLLSELATQPYLQGKLRQELQSVLSLNQHKDLIIKPDSKLSRESCCPVDLDYSKRMIDEIDQLPFLEALLKETLRRYPPIAFQVRVPQEDHIIQGKLIPMGSVIQLSIFALQHLPQYWGDNPIIFDPHRFLSTDGVDIDDKLMEFRNSLAMLTFSVGNRACIGRKFSLYETKCVIARLVMQWKFSLPVEEEFLKPTPIDAASPFILRPRELRLNVLPLS